MRGLDGKVVAITGAAGGIGRALVSRFADEGATVMALDVNQAGLGELAGAEARCQVHVLDITDHGAVRTVVGRIASDHGRIDVLVNNAGYDVVRQFVDTDPALWEKVIAINLTGPLNMHHAVLPVMIANGGGRIVNIASDAGRVGSSGESIYSACKGGIVAFTKTIARETARNNIKVNAVCPGPTDTPLLRSFLGEGDFGQKLYEGLQRAIPLKRLGRPEDLTGIVAFLASDEADYITGQVISVSGGLTMHG